MKLGFSKKGNSMKKIDELLIELYGTKSGGKIINLGKFVEAMSSKLGSFLRRKILKKQTEEETKVIEKEEKIGIETVEKTVDDAEVINENGEDDGALQLARAIQRANHMIEDRTKVDKMKDREDEEKASVLLAHPNTSFLHDMDEILRNTMFNIIQEAIHDEFSITSEPMKFLSSPERERGNSVTIGDF